MKMQNCTGVLLFLHFGVVSQMHTQVFLYSKIVFLFGKHGCDNMVTTPISDSQGCSVRLGRSCVRVLNKYIYIYIYSFFYSQQFLPSYLLLQSQGAHVSRLSIPYRTGRNIPYRPAIRYAQAPYFVLEKIPVVPANFGQYRPVQKKVFFFIYFFKFCNF